MQLELSIHKLQRIGPAVIKESLIAGVCQYTQILCEALFELWDSGTFAVWCIGSLVHYILKNLVERFGVNVGDCRKAMLLFSPTTSPTSSRR